MPLLTVESCEKYSQTSSQIRQGILQQTQSTLEVCLIQGWEEYSTKAQL